MVCLIRGCTRPAKRGKSRSTGHPERWTWAFGKYCSMHYERRRRTGQFGGAQPEHNPPGTPWLGSNGYLKITHNGQETYVHRSVWEQHSGWIPPGYHIHHKDGNKLNNRLSNLELLFGLEHLRWHAVKTIAGLSLRQRRARLKQALEAKRRKRQKRSTHGRSHSFSQDSSVTPSPR